MMRVFLVATACLLIVTGCGAKNNSARVSNQTTGLNVHYHPAQARVPACAHAGKAVAFPANFPQNFPVPPGTAITGHRTPIGGGIAATGFVPARSFKQTVNFFPPQLKRAGFKVLHREVDAPHDSEGSYEGHGYLGGWALRAMPGCAAMTIQISAKKK